MSRKPRPEELRIWALVASTVRPAAGRTPVAPPSEDELPITASSEMSATTARVRSKPARPAAPPEDIEPGRKRRIVRERDPLDLRLDLHGLDQGRARAVLFGFLQRAQADGERAVLVITGKGTLGDGVLRRQAPDWLADPALRGVVAGWSPAHKKHGGDGALYVALKRRAG